MNKPTNQSVETQDETGAFETLDTSVPVPQGKQVTSAASDNMFPLVLDGTEHLIDLQDMDGQALVDLAGRCSSASEPVRMDLTNLPKFAQPDRLRIIDFTALIKRKAVLVGGRGFDDLLEAVLSLLKPGLTTLQLTQVKLTALEVAALLFSSSLAEACQRIQKQLRDIGQKGIKLVDLIREAKRVHNQLEGLVSQSEDKGQTLVKEKFPDSPVPDTLQLPPFWSVAEGGLHKLSGRIAGKLSSPVFVTAILQDDTGKQAVKLCWCTLGSWQSKIVDRIDIADKARCTALASLGVPVTSNSAGLLVQFLEEFIFANEQELQLVKTVSKMGFHRDGEKTVFVLGRTVITSEGVISTKDSTVADSAPAHKLKYRGHDLGLDQLAEGYHAVGSFEVWRTQIASLLRFPRLRIMLMASFVSVMLEITNTANFIVSVAGRTTTGKTSALKICASVWGCPNVDADASLLSTWDATPTHRERLRLTLSNLPIFLDETKLAKGSEQEVPKHIYSASSGRSRGRGSLTGIARQESSRNITFISGEQAATSFAQDGGAYARVLELLGSPFGENSPHTGVLVREATQAIGENYGQAGPMFVQYLLKHEANWPEWRKQYRQLVTQYETNAGSNHILSRQASYLAAITLASKFAHAALGLPGDWTDPVEPLWDEICQATQASDLPKSALLLAYYHALKLKDRFQLGSQIGKSNDFGNKVSQDVMGRWEVKQHNHLGCILPNGSAADDLDFDWIGYFPQELDKLLRDHQYQPDAIIRQWRDSGWLVTDDEKKTPRNQKTTTINGLKTRVYAISSAAIAKALS